MKALSLSLPTVSLPTAVTIISTSTSLLSPHAHPGSFPPLPLPVPLLLRRCWFWRSNSLPHIPTCGLLSHMFLGKLRAGGGAAGWVDKGHARRTQHEFSERRGSHLRRRASRGRPHKRCISTKTNVQPERRSWSAGRGAGGGAAGYGQVSATNCYWPSNQKQSNKSSWICIATGLPPRAPYSWKKILL